jgi:hypothetical protein
VPSGTPRKGDRDMHRKTSTIDRAAMIRHLAAGFALLSLTVALLATLFATVAPSAAGIPAAPTWQAQSAAKLAHDATHLRPYWNGRSPAVWTSETPAMCLAKYHGRHGWIRIDNQGPRWRAECLPDGHEYAWGLPDHP